MPTIEHHARRSMYEGLMFAFLMFSFYVGHDLLGRIYRKVVA